MTFRAFRPFERKLFKRVFALCDADGAVLAYKGRADRAREELYRRIDCRVGRMFGAGLVGEVKALLAAGYGADDPGLRGIGYREVLEMRSGCETFGAVRDRIARSTRRYAKRQLTFFRAVPGVRWMDPDDPTAVGAAMDAFVREST